MVDIVLLTLLEGRRRSNERERERRELPFGDCSCLFLTAAPKEIGTKGQEVGGEHGHSRLGMVFRTQLTFTLFGVLKGVSLKRERGTGVSIEDSVRLLPLPEKKKKNQRDSGSQGYSKGFVRHLCSENGHLASFSLPEKGETMEKEMRRH